MARVFRKKLNVNDYPEEQRGWLTDLFFNLDESFGSIQTAFDRRTNFRENFDADVRVIEDLQLSDVTNENITIIPTTRSLPNDVIATVILADTSRVTVPVSWRVNDDGSITITNLNSTNVTGIFTLRLTVLGD